jgi:hypothetical protein
MSPTNVVWTIWSKAEDYGVKYGQKRQHQLWR